MAESNKIPRQERISLHGFVPAFPVFLPEAGSAGGVVDSGEPPAGWPEGVWALVQEGVGPVA
ncbi:hypothetical protein GCM10007416_25230 [Kroppenstedtia guangzhouensis]|uniref:Uncharacterized protein n=1 Tax=Kroppenstedtia guangzhouensis TaxID=1274356 RepID=A0ABQ1GV58_9BACL|nr:hypothetical protein [Kroppenstedtia guangzhouensis]GGA51010.1 hypothetical protein GCM10007416_25230 [Kroppenstedtia guangzhouensis]